ncbi:MAG: tetratricopeptide repeat protein [Bacteroidales bacterium]
MKKIDFSYFIERYISDEMKPEEKAWFEKELDGDPALRKELNLRKETDEILRRDSDIRALRNKIRVIAADHTRKKPATVRISVAKYAAAITLFILAGSTIWLFSGKLSNEEIFEQYYTVVPVAGESVSRSLSLSPDDAYIQAVNEYKKGDYDKAISLFLQYTTLEEDNPELYMMLGNSYAEKEQFTEAGANYRRVIDHNDNLYIEDANWMLALCYLRTGDSEKARMQLSMIASSDSRHSRNAVKALRKLK